MSTMDIKMPISDFGFRVSDLKKRPAPRALACALAVGLLALFAITTPASAQSDNAPEVLPDPQDMARVEASVDRALAYLISKQRPDGSFMAWVGNNNAINALGLLALLGRGHVPGQGPYWPAVNKAVAAIAATQDARGLYLSPNVSSGPMYEHGLATLAMIEAYGFVPTAAMRQSVQKAVDLIVASQSTAPGTAGGWRYHPQPTDADLSVTVMQVVAIHSAMNARLKVPENTVQNALVYIRRCAIPTGGYSYGPGGGASPATTAGGCLAMQLLGAFDDPSVKKGLDYLHTLNFGSNMHNYFWYTNYYAMQANYQAGGDYWAKWNPKVRDFLLAVQHPDGSWPGFQEQAYNGNEALCYSTAMGAIALEVYLHYLPAYQR